MAKVVKINTLSKVFRILIFAWWFRAIFLIKPVEYPTGFFILPNEDNVKIYFDIV